jgi:hypothetical protein
VPGEEELRARAVLAEMQMRISMGPNAALSVAETATAEQVRAAFLDLTKQFHPARFGRMAGDIQRLANEVFLGIKAAHDHLMKNLGTTGRFPPAGRPSTGVPIAGPGSGGTVRGTGLVRPSTPLGRGTDRPGTRPSNPQIPTPPMGIPRTTTPLTTPVGGTRAGTPPGAPRAPTPPAGVPLQRPSAPSIDTGERRPTPPSGIPAQSRPTSPSGIPQRPSSPMQTARPSTPQVQRTPPPDLNPPTIRYSGVQPAAQSSGSSGSLPRMTDEDAEVRHAMSLLSSKEWSAARLAFHALAAKFPQTRQYRALLCYSRGRETQASGRPDDALMEFQRALQLDPDLQIAKDAIREVQRKSRF